MRKAVVVALVALAWSALPVARAQAWGFTLHMLIADRAVELLPPALKPFFVTNRVAFVQHAIDPDTYRTVGWADEDPRHFLDMDNYGPFPFKALPHDYTAAVEARGVDFVKKNGVLPWRTEEIYGKLRDSFRQVGTAAYARDNIKLFSSVIAHYVADGYQPFHAAANYDGQLTGQNGIHARFETELFERFSARVAIAPPPPAPIPNPRDYMFATLTDSFSYVQPILDADRQAAAGREFYDDAYFAAFFAGTQPVLEKRVSGAIAGVASMITQAWIDAGRPVVPVDAPPRPPRPIKR